MTVERIALTGFRNYTGAVFDLSPDVNVICGANAQGKTNLLEAVYLLSGSHSFRNFPDRDLIGFDQDWAEIAARVNTGGRTGSLQILLSRTGPKKVRINAAPRTAFALGEWVHVVLFFPEDLFLVKAGAKARRDFLDEAISQLRPGYASLLKDFKNLYKEKKKILEQWQTREDLQSTLDDFCASLAVCSAKMIRYRASFIQKLAQAAEPIHGDFSGGGEKLTVSYLTDSVVTDPTAPATEIFGQLWQRQQEVRREEIRAGRCLTGIQGDDMLIAINGRDARKFASQGQARTAALSLKLAERELFQADTGEYPVLLLDDVLSELDAARQEFVLNRIGGGQTLITCCEQEDISRRTGGKVFQIEKGHPV